MARPAPQPTPASQPPFSRALVVGCPGAGKSTFARKLRDVTGLPLHYLDTIWHLPDGTHVERDEFNRRLDALLARDRWIIDGNYQRTLSRRLERADIVFFFDLPTEVCLAGAAARIGHPREDLPWLERELDPEFVRYIQRFPVEQASGLLSLLDARPDTTRLVTFRAREEADTFLAAIA